MSTGDGCSTGAAYEKPASAFVAGFLGKTNVLRLPDEVVSVRPERIRFDGEGRLEGRIATRIFQGNHWLYQIETADGLLTVIRQNTGEAMPAEGDGVHLAWGTT